MHELKKVVHPYYRDLSKKKKKTFLYEFNDRIEAILSLISEKSIYA